jgi:hypothetical protein
MLFRIHSAAKGIEAGCHAARKSPTDLTPPRKGGFAPIFLTKLVIKLNKSILKSHFSSANQLIRSSANQKG